MAEQPVQQPLSLYDPATQSFPVQVLAGAVDPTQCFAFGGGLRSALAGEQASFTIRARDKFQNRKILGGDAFWGQFTQDGASTYINATDNADGTYSIKYALTTSGYYTVKLSHPLKDGFFEQIPDRNVMLKNSPGPISLASFASGPGLSSGSESCTVKSTQNFMISLKDRYLNNITVGDSAAFAVYVTSGSGPLHAFRRSEQNVFPIENTFPVEDETAAYLAESEGRSDIVNWLRRCAAMPALHRLCDRRADEDNIAELLRGGADPFLRSAAGETPLEICRLADAALGALPAREETTAVIAAAVIPWHHLRHGLFPRTFTQRKVCG